MGGWWSYQQTDHKENECKGTHKNGVFDKKREMEWITKDPAPTSHATSRGCVLRMYPDQMAAWSNGKIEDNNGQEFGDMTMATTKFGDHPGRSLLNVVKDDTTGEI